MAEREKERVRTQLRWQQRGHMLWGEDPRPPHTLSQALTFLLNKGKETNRILQLLTAVVQRRKSLGESQ
jgi:hypothetical protein